MYRETDITKHNKNPSSLPPPPLFKQMNKIVVSSIMILCIYMHSSYINTLYDLHRYTLDLYLSINIDNSQGQFIFFIFSFLFFHMISLLFYNIWPMTCTHLLINILFNFFCFMCSCSNKCKWKFSTNEVEKQKQMQPRQFDSNIRSICNHLCI